MDPLSRQEVRKEGGSHCRGFDYSPLSHTKIREWIASVSTNQSVRNKSNYLFCLSSISTFFMKKIFIIIIFRVTKFQGFFCIKTGKRNLLTHILCKKICFWIIMTRAAIFLSFYCSGLAKYQIKGKQFRLCFYEALLLHCVSKILTNLTWSWWRFQAQANFR